MSERDFSKIPPSIWRDRRFLALDSDGRTLLFYFRTSPHHNASGCYRVPDAYAAADLTWEVDQYLAVRAALVEAGLIAFDAETSEVYVVDWFRANAPKGPKQEIGCRRCIEWILSHRLAEKVIADFEAAAAAPTGAGGSKVIPLPLKTVS